VDNFVHEFVGWMRESWVAMLEPPWSHRPDTSDWLAEDVYWPTWIIGWLWTIAGILLGALIAPSLLQLVGLAHATYSDWLVIGVAVVAGFFVQLIGFTLVNILNAVTPGDWGDLPVLQLWLLVPIGIVFILLPFAGVGYGIYRYLTWVGPSQRSVTVAFVGALLAKTLLIPLIKSIVTGALIRWIARVLRGGKVKKA
jgi:hypothetical protein